MSDSLIDGAKKQYRNVQAAEARCQANLAEYIADGNEEGIAEELGTMSILELQKDKLNQMYDRHVQSQQPQQPQHRAPESGMEFIGKPAEKMGGDDGLKIVNYGKSPSDPTWLSPAEYNEQVAELRRAKQRGMYKD